MSREDGLAGGLDADDGARADGLEEARLQLHTPLYRRISAPEPLWVAPATPPTPEASPTPGDGGGGDSEEDDLRVKLHTPLYRKVSAPEPLWVEPRPQLRGSVMLAPAGGLPSDSDDDDEEEEEAPAAAAPPAEPARRQRHTIAVDGDARANDRVAQILEARRRVKEQQEARIIIT